MTRGRVGNQITLRSIPYPWRDSTYLVCNEDEAPKHTHQTIVCPDNITNYSQKFQWIADGRACNDNKVVIMDDDLHFNKRDPSGAEKLLKIDNVEEINDLFDYMSQLLETTALVGVHPRQMGHIQKLPYVSCSKMICIQGINRELCVPMPKVDQFPILADVMLNCSILERGMQTKLITTFLQDHASCQAPGGCSLTRTPEMQKEAVEWVAERFAPHAKAVTKRPKQAKWMGDERTDLRVQWKQLFKANGGVL